MNFNVSAWSQNGKIRLADYPSLQNPQVITSTVAFGDTSVFFCSFNRFVGTDGNIYIIDIPTAAVAKGAKLINKHRNHYIRVF